MEFSGRWFAIAFSSCFRIDPSDDTLGNSESGHVVLGRAPSQPHLRELGCPELGQSDSEGAWPSKKNYPKLDKILFSDEPQSMLLAMPECCAEDKAILAIGGFHGSDGPNWLKKEHADVYGLLAQITGADPVAGRPFDLDQFKAQD